MKKNSYLIILGLILLLTNNVFGDPAEIIVKGVKVVIPSGWTFENSNEPSLIFRIYAPQNNENDLYLKNLTLTTDEITNGKTLKDLLDEGQDEMSRLFENFNVISKSLDNPDNVNLTFEYTVQGVRLKVKQIVTRSGNKAYVFTYTTQYEKFNDYSFHFEKIINSVKFMNKK